MYKKILFLTLIILFLIPVFTDATAITVKGKSGYSLMVNILNPLNDEPIAPSVSGDIDISGQKTFDVSISNPKANIFIIARVNGKIVKQKKLTNVNTQSTSPIIVDLLETPPAPTTTQHAPAPAVQNTTPAPAPTPTPAPTPPPEPAPTPETKENKTRLLTGMATSFESINLSQVTKKILIYVSIGISIIVLVIIVIIVIIKRKRKGKLNSHESFKITKLSHLAKESPEHEDIEEAEKRLKVAKDEINRINEILNKRRAVKEAEQKLEEERRALEKLKKGFR